MHDHSVCCSLTSSSIHTDSVLVWKQHKTAQIEKKIKDQFLHIINFFRQTTNFLFIINIDQNCVKTSKTLKNMLLKAFWASKKKMYKWQLLLTLKNIEITCSIYKLLCVKKQQLRNQTGKRPVLLFLTTYFFIKFIKIL